MKKFLTLVFLTLFFFAPSFLRAQDVSGMTGTVTDATGAAVPGTTVTLVNKTTGVKFTQTTNGSGTYRFQSIPPGQGYEAIFTHSGFADIDVKDIYLTVANVRTQNAQLLAGANQEVEVTASNSVVTINTTDATIGNTFDVKMLNSLPVQQRSDPTALFTLQPGVTDQGSTTGARTDQNYVTLDGLDVNDFATGNSSQTNSGVTQGFEGGIVGHAPVDAIEEFHATVGGFASSTGLASGGQFQLVTKSGTNTYHGNINEYHRDPSLVANSWFSNNSSPVVPRNHLIQNQFGGNIGGPIRIPKLYNGKDKAFFFFNFNDSRVISDGLVSRTVPLASLRNGLINYYNTQGAIVTSTLAQQKALDPQGLGQNTAFIAAYASRFPVSNAAGGDGINSGGYNFNAPDDDFATNYTGRVDYNLTGTQKLYARFTVSHENSTENLNEFSGDPSTNPFLDRTYAFVLGHDWVIGNNKTNQFYLGETVENYGFPNLFNPDGPNFFTFGDGTQASLTSSFYLNPDAQSRRVPVMQVGDNFTWTKGRHTIQIGGIFEDIRPVNTNKSDFHTAIIGLGGQTLGLNASLRPSNIYTAPSNATAAQTALQNTAQQTWDQAFAFVLGRVAAVSTPYNYTATGTALPLLTGDVRIYQNFETNVYVADTWKATPELTVTYGLNYQLFSVPYETRGLESTETMSFDNYMKARITQSNAGATGPTAVPIISYVLGGKANNGPSIYKPDHKDFGPRVAFAYNPSWDRKTVFNAGASIVYDRTIINAVQQIQDADSYLFQQPSSVSFGTQGNPNASLLNDPRLTSGNSLPASALAQVVAPATPKPPYAPFATDAVCAPQGLVTPCGLQNGQDFNATIDPALKTPYSLTVSAGMQHAFGDFVMKLGYAGRFGRNLLAQADANQILEFPDKVSGQLYSNAFASLTQQIRAGTNPANVTPQPFFENILGAGASVFLAENLTGLVHNGDFGDFTQALAALGAPLNLGSAAQFSENSFYTSKGFSSYNALLVSLQKNLSHGLQFNVNYTFAHSIDNTSLFANSEGDTGIGGIGLICDDIRPRECRANSDFDINNYVTATTTYQLPFGRHREFLSNIPIWANELIGGWDISGITDWHSGLTWGTSSNAYDASYSNDAPGILVGQASAVRTNLQKLPGGGVNIFKSQTAAQAAYVGPIGFQIGARNSLRGPGYFNQDLGLGKTFPLSAERVNLNFRADAFNALNHPNFALPQSNGYNGFDQQDFTSTTFGNITSTVAAPGNHNNGARVVQVSLRLEF